MTDEKKCIISDKLHLKAPVHLYLSTHTHTLFKICYIFMGIVFNIWDIIFVDMNLRINNASWLSFMSSSDQVLVSTLNCET